LSVRSWFKGRHQRRSHGSSALFFLAPNLVGFLCFTLGPLLFSLVMAFSNWDLRLHNRFKDEPVHFVGLTNFTRLLSLSGESGFWRYLSNNLIFLLGMPPAIAASLTAALLLSNEMGGRSRRVVAWLVGTIFGVGSVVFLCAAGAGTTAGVLLICGLFFSVVLGGLVGRLTFYRTLFYLPNFPAGVATMLLWKRLFQPAGGPINAALDGETNVFFGKCHDVLV